MVTANTLQHVPAAIAIRVASRRIAIIRTAARGRGVVLGHITRLAVMRGEELPAAVREQLSASEQMQAGILLDRWRREQELQQQQQQLAAAVADLERLTALFSTADGVTGSDLMAAVEQYRLQAVVTAWEALGVALRERAQRHGAEHLVSLLTMPVREDEEPIVIASDQSDTQTISEDDAAQLRGEQRKRKK